jgi:uncharacterized protein (UPF0297 family)
MIKYTDAHNVANHMEFHIHQMWNNVNDTLGYIVHQMWNNVNDTVGYIVHQMWNNVNDMVGYIVQSDALVHNNAPVNRRENTDGIIFKDTPRINQYESNACQYRTTCTNNISNEDTTENSVNHSVNLEQTSLKTVQIDTNDENVPNNSVKHKPDIEVKQSELRQKEQKRRKS